MANSVDPDHTTRYLAPDLALHGLLRQILMVTIVLDQSRVKVTQVIKGKFFRNSVFSDLTVLLYSVSINFADVLNCIGY